MNGDVQIIQAAVGAHRKVKLTLPPGTYTGSETLAASVWPGDDQAESFAPTVAWLVADDRTVTMEWAGSLTATLAPGRYPIELRITSSGVTDKLRAAVLELLWSPGTGTAGPVYISYDRMRREAGVWLNQVEAGEGQQAGFAEERAAARRELDEAILARYDGGSGGDGVAHWLGSSPLLRSVWLKDLLDADALVITEPVAEWNALRALATICRRRMKLMAGDPFAKLADDYRRRADSLLGSLTIELDTDADGVANLAVPMGTIRILRG